MVFFWGFVLQFKVYDCYGCIIFGVRQVGFNCVLDMCIGRYYDLVFSVGG